MLKGDVVKRKKNIYYQYLLIKVSKIGFELVETGASIPRACDGESRTRASRPSGGVPSQCLQRFALGSGILR